MAQRETYVRVSVKGTRFEVVAGLEWRVGDYLAGLRRTVRILVEQMLAVQTPEDDMMTISELVAAEIVANYQDRAYFIEVCSIDDDRDWVQVFDPRGFVKERCDCPCVTAALLE